MTTPQSLACDYRALPRGWPSRRSAPQGPTDSPLLCGTAVGGRRGRSRGWPAPGGDGGGHTTANMTYAEPEVHRLCEPAYQAVVNTVCSSGCGRSAVRYGAWCCVPAVIAQRRESARVATWGCSLPLQGESRRCCISFDVEPKVRLSLVVQKRGKARDMRAGFGSGAARARSLTTRKHYHGVDATPAKGAEAVGQGRVLHRRIPACCLRMAALGPHGWQRRGRGRCPPPSAPCVIRRPPADLALLRICVSFGKSVFMFSARTIPSALHASESQRFAGLVRDASSQLASLAPDARAWRDAVSCLASPRPTSIGSSLSAPPPHGGEGGRESWP